MKFSCHFEQSQPASSYTTDLMVLEHLQGRSFLLLATTLSTIVKSDFHAHGSAFRELWDKHLMERVRRRLPYKYKDTALFDSHIVECGHKGTWHFHGTIAIPPYLTSRYWENDCLNHHLSRDLEALRFRGEYRSYAITSFEMKPVEDLSLWHRYCHKRRHQKAYDPAC
jgi:hypothetical protein